MAETQNEYQLRLNLAPEASADIPIVYARQGDQNSVLLKIELYQSGALLTDLWYVGKNVFYVAQSDSISVKVHATDIMNGQILVSVPSTVFKYSGLVPTNYIRVEDLKGNELVSTGSSSFRIYVRSGTYYPGIEEFYIEEFEKLREYLLQLASSIEPITANAATYLTTQYQTLKYYIDDLYKIDEQGYEYLYKLSHDTLMEVRVMANEIDTLIANAGNGTVPSELLNVRVGADGITYLTAGDAVRKQLERKVDMSVGANLVDKLSATQGYYVSSTAGAKNVLETYQYNTIYSKPATKYYMNTTGNIHIAFFDATSVFISGLVDPTSFDTPINCAYFTVSYPKTKADVIMVSASPIVDYANYIEGIDGDDILPDTVDETKLTPEFREQILGGTTVVKYKAGLNILDTSNAEVGFYRSYTTGFKITMAPYQISRVEVSSLNTYYLRGGTNIHLTFFAEDGSFISGLLTPTSFTPPTGTKFMYISYNTSHKDLITLSLTPLTTYVKFQNGIDGEEINDGTVQMSAFAPDVIARFGNDVKIIKVGPGQEYTSLVAAVRANQGTINHYELVRYRCDLVAEYELEYGANYFLNYVRYLTTNKTEDRGINLRNGESITADVYSSISFNYTGSNQEVIEFFSPLNLSMNNTVSGLDLKIKDGCCRYIIHDDFAWGNEGANIIEYCNLEGESHFHTGIGGGMGMNCFYHINHCNFYYTGQWAVTYHNNSQAGAINEYRVSNCYLTPGSSIRGTYYGASTEVSKMIVTQCEADKIVCTAHEVNVPNVNLELLEFNNTIRIPN